MPADFQAEEPVILGRIVRGERIDHYETIRQRKDGTTFNVSLTVSPVRDSSGQVIGASKVCRDITQKKIAEKRQRLLLKEMNHRVKNLFAVASGVVAASARSATTAKELADVVRSRLGALARAQDLILASDQAVVHKIELLDLVRVILAPYDTNNGHIKVSGPAVECQAGAATSLALMLHEFATNSIKYGALSDAAGRIAVQFDTDGQFTLTWTESAGPPIQSAPAKRGFGDVLVDATIRGMGGTIEQAWPETGLRIRMTVPLERIVAIPLPEAQLDL
jgi:two-component sensor histidine kinase